MSTAAKGNWHILGAGAQGLLWAAQFARAQLPVQLLLRTGASDVQADSSCDERSAPLASGPAASKPADSEPATSEPFASEPLASEPAAPASAASNRANHSVSLCYEHDGARTLLPVATGAITPIRRLLVTVKAGDVGDALRGIRDMLADDVLLLILANGIGAEAAARAVLPQARILMGTSTHGSFRRERLHVVHAGIGSIRIGPGEGEAERLGAELIQGLPESMAIVWDTQIRERLWRKLAINACINPLTAVLDCRNGELLHNADVQHDWPLLADEAAAVLRGEGIAISAAELLDELRAVATATANNFSSMHQDITHGRRSENAWITGALSEAAQRHGLSLPTHGQWQARLARRCAETGSPG